MYVDWEEEERAGFEVTCLGWLLRENVVFYRDLEDDE